MSNVIGLQEAKEQLSELIGKAINGEEIFISQGNQAIVQLVPKQQKKKRRLGTAKGKIFIKEDFKDIPPEFQEYLP